MELSISNSDLTITGNIKSVSDFQAIKQTLDKLVSTKKTIRIIIIDSISITSSVIGYLTKLIYKEEVKLSLQIGSPLLIELLTDLGLETEFHITKG